MHRVNPLVAFGACFLFAALVSVHAGCAPAVRSTHAGPMSEAELAQLWVHPRDLAQRDLFHAPAAATWLPILQPTSSSSRRIRPGTATATTWSAPADSSGA